MKSFKCLLLEDGKLFNEGLRDHNTVNTVDSKEMYILNYSVFFPFIFQYISISICYICVSSLCLPLHCFSSSDVLSFNPPKLYLKLPSIQSIVLVFRQSTNTVAEFKL